MKKPKIRAFACLLAVMLCMMAFSFPALAESSEWDDEEYEVSYDLNEEDEPVEYTEEEPAEDTAGEPQIDPPAQESTEESEPEEAPDPEAEPEPDPEPEETTGGIDEDELDELLGGLLSAFTPEGNLSLIDDFTFTGLDADGNEIQKQFITVQSKNGNYFYIIIDRVGESQNVYFLNMVDEADLLALLETGEEPEPEPEVCTCKDKCYAGHVDTTCPICAKDMTRCVGQEPEPEPEPEPETPEEPQQQNNTGALLGIVLILALGGGAAYYFLKVKGGKSKPKTRGDTDLDDYDYGADDDEYAEFEPYEDEGTEDSD